MNNLLHISGNKYPPLHGKNHHTKSIWKHLAKGFDEYHIMARSETNCFSYSKERNIHLHLIPKVMEKSRIFFLTSFLMIRIIKKFQITHLLTQCPVTGMSSILYSRYFKIPCMVEVHGEEYFRYLEQRGILARIVKFSFKNAVKIRSLNQKMSEKLDKYGIFENVILIPNRVDFNTFDRTKNDFAINNRVNLVSVGRFVWEKNYLDLIKALHKSHIDFHLTLIGGGPLKEEYEFYLLENSIQDNVTLIDKVDQKDLIEFILKGDIYIQSSVSEGMPRAILEAMALQMPIISTNVGSILGVLENRYNALVIEPKNNDQLISAIRSLISNYSLRKKIALQGYSDAKEKYNSNKIFELYRSEIKSMQFPDTF